jgi:oxygen-independent coproporphyrinogen-3 oxidase
MRPISLYIHVPFCTRRCSYCSFYHVARNPEHESGYLEALLDELTWALADIGEVRFETVFVGGGTPSTLGAGGLERIVTALEGRIASGAEVTCELNPEDVTAGLAAALVELGVNRVSLGVQSMDAAAQGVLKRCSPPVNRRAIDLLARHFENMSFDVLLGIPGSSPAVTRTTLDELVALRPAHLSVYCLEPGGDMGREVERFFDRVDPERSADEYLETCAVLGRAGYRHYEVSNFARHGFDSMHNRVYWSGGEYLGLGPGAHSFIAGKRFHNPPSLQDYLSRRGPQRAAARVVDAVDDEGSHLERAMLALRTDRGMPLAWARCPRETIDGFVAEGLARRVDDRLVLTDRGFLVTNDVLLRVCAAA